MKRIARIFSEGHNYHFSDEALDYLDARGHGYDSKAEAMRAASESGYTHATGSGTYWNGIKAIPKRYQTEDVNGYRDHLKSLAEETENKNDYLAVDEK